MTNEVNQILLWYRYISLKITKKNFKKSIKLVMLGIFLLSNLGSVLEWDYFNIFANRNDSKEQRWFWIIWFFSFFESGYYWQCTTLTWQDKQCIDVAQTKNGYIVVYKNINAKMTFLYQMPTLFNLKYLPTHSLLLVLPTNMEK